LPHAESCLILVIIVDADEAERAEEVIAILTSRMHGKNRADARIVPPERALLWRYTREWLYLHGVSARI